MISSSDDFSLEWHGNAVVISPSANVEQMPWDVIEQAVEIILAPLSMQTFPMAVIDLSGVDRFGSLFLAFLLKIHTAVKGKGGEMVLCGSSRTSHDLLRLTGLDTLWAMYETRAEALDAIDH